MVNRHARTANRTRIHQKNEKQGSEDPIKGCITCDVSPVKAVNPDGFIRKPFDDGSLKIAIELGLKK